MSEGCPSLCLCLSNVPRWSQDPLWLCGGVARWGLPLSWGVSRQGQPGSLQLTSTQTSGQQVCPQQWGGVGVSTAEGGVGVSTVEGRVGVSTAEGQGGCVYGRGQSGCVYSRGVEWVCPLQRGSGCVHNRG